MPGRSPPRAGLLRPLPPDHGEQRRRRLQMLFVVAAAGLAALVPLILFAGFWTRSELNKAERDIESYLSVRASTLSRLIDAELEHQLAAMHALTALPDLDGDAVDFGNIARRVQATVPRWSAFGLADATGRRVVATTREGWPAEKVFGLVSEAVEARQPRIRAGSALGLPGGSVLLLVPVVRSGEARMALVTALDPAGLYALTADANRAADLTFTVADGRTSILAHPTPQDEVPDDLAARFADKAAGLIRSKPTSDDPHVSAFVRSPLTGWVTLASMDSRQIERLSNRSIWATIAAGTLSIILAGILTVFVVHTVMQRRASDERLAASRALGELDARLLATTQEALGEQRKASSEREVLLREIYHRVKNNLQIVQSLLRLGSRDLSPDQREPFEGAVRRIGAMARVHTLLYNSPDLASIDFKDYLGELVKEMSEGFGAEERSIASVLNAASMRVPLDTAVPLAFIAVEILTNAYRHAFPPGRAGRITIEITQDPPYGTLRIEDDGVGVAKDAPSKRRLGLTIVRKLVQQIDGTLEEPEPGSSAFVVRFPIKEEAAESEERLPMPAA